MVIHELHDEAGDFRDRVSNDLDESNDVRPRVYVLQYLDLPFNFGLLDGFENFDDASCRAFGVPGLEDL